MPFITIYYQSSDLWDRSIKATGNQLTELVWCRIVLKCMLHGVSRPSGARSACVCVELREGALQWCALFQACSLNSTQTASAELQRDSARAAHNTTREENGTERRRKEQWNSSDARGPNTQPVRPVTKNKPDTRKTGRTFGLFSRDTNIKDTQLSVEKSELWNPPDVSVQGVKCWILTELRM